MASAPYLCASCARVLRRTSRPLLRPAARRLSRSSRLSYPSSDRSNPEPPPPTPPSPPEAQSQSQPSSAPGKGPMSRRLEQATEDALLSGGRAGRRAVAEAGFSEELKARLLEKLADAQFQSDHAAALADAGLLGDYNDKIPPAAGQGTRQVATAQPWTGEETTEDAVLRMLDDARKPLAPGLRGKPKLPEPAVVDMRMRREGAVSRGARAASARDRAQAYAGLGISDKGLSEEEREAVRREFRERFRPGARAMPSTVSGLAALANERIEDAIARGQFKNIPRGPGVERDTRADNPFIDTTEYIMNKMIKRQEIVPPWIEKQQELLRAATVFRKRLRSDWRRHAARMIASRGGSLKEQMDRAAAYARAEEAHNPRRKPVDQISVPTNATDDVVMVRIRQQPGAASEDPAASSAEHAAAPTSEEDATLDARPFRDPDWEAAERPYMELAIENLNAITRSYNLMAPELAKKPYFSLQRELDGCYAEVAPDLANEIKTRATAAPPREASGRARGILERLGSEGEGTATARVYDSKAPHYGLKEFWRDLWAAPK